MRVAPCLYYYSDTYGALGVTETEMRLLENSPRLLLQKLDDILLYIEPSPISMQTYSHKTRELLILACTEVENFWQSALRKTNSTPTNKRNYTTRDYAKLATNLYLSDYSIKLKSYAYLTEFSPFKNWDVNAPTNPCFGMRPIIKPNTTEINISLRQH